MVMMMMKRMSLRWREHCCDLMLDDEVHATVDRSSPTEMREAMSDALSQYVEDFIDDVREELEQDAADINEEMRDALDVKGQVQ